MKKLLMMFLSIFSCFSIALSDKIAIVANGDIITETELKDAVDNYAIVFGDSAYTADPAFQKHVSRLMALNVLLKDFARRNNIELTAEEELSSIKHMVAQKNKSLDEWPEVAAELGVDADWLKSYVLVTALQQKIASIVVMPNISVSEDEIAHAKSQYMLDNTIYKLKSWTVGFDEAVDEQSVLALKHQWAETGKDPEVGQVHDIPWRKAGELPEIFLKAIEDVAPGNLVGPIQSEYGIHLIWFEGQTDPEMPAEQSIQGPIVHQKYQIELEKWFEQLEAHSVVIYK